MSKPSLVAKERQPGSPFGLRQKQAKEAQKIKKIRSKRATVAPYFSCVTRELQGFF
jgi:hypothetical protein